MCGDTVEVHFLMSWIDWLIIALAIGVGIYGIITYDNYHECEIRKTTEWGFEWDHHQVERIIARFDDNPLIEIEYDIHPGSYSAPGRQIVFVDTLIVTVSGPHQEVIETAAAIEQLIY